jgi:Inner membrane protein YgaP-like, transmembrane domain
VAAFGFWFTVTGAIGVCPAYKPFGITTLRTGRRRVPHLAQREVPQVHRSREDALR